MIANFADLKIKKSFDYIFEILKLININLIEQNELNNLIIDRSLLTNPEINQQVLVFREKMKGLFHPSYLTCLHNNSELKQKYPAINMLRQLLKCLNGLLNLSDLTNFLRRKHLEILLMIILA